MSDEKVECAICEDRVTRIDCETILLNDDQHCHPILYYICLDCKSSVFAHGMRSRKLEIPNGFIFQSSSLVAVRDSTFTYHRSPDTHYTCYCGEVICYDEVQSQIHEYGTRKGFKYEPLRCENAACLNTIDNSFDFNHVGYNNNHDLHIEYVTTETVEKKKPHPFASHVPIHVLTVETDEKNDHIQSMSQLKKQKQWCCQCAHCPKNTSFLKPHMSMITRLLPEIRWIVSSYVGRFESSENESCEPCSNYNFTTPNLPCL